MQQVSSKVGDIISDTGKVFDSVKQAVKTSVTSNEKKKEFVNDVSHDKLDDFVESHRMLNEKKTNDETQSGFTTAHSERQRSQESEHFMPVGTSQTKSGSIGRHAGTVAASVSTIAFDTVAREASKQFKVVAEAIQTPLITRQPPKKQKAKPVGNFKQTVKSKHIEQQYQLKNLSA